MLSKLSPPKLFSSLQGKKCSSLYLLSVGTNPLKQYHSVRVGVKHPHPNALATFPQRLLFCLGEEEHSNRLGKVTEFGHQSIFLRDDEATFYPSLCNLSDCCFVEVYLYTTESLCLFIHFIFCAFQHKLESAIVFAVSVLLAWHARDSTETMHIAHGENATKMASVSPPSHHCHQKSYNISITSSLS